MANEEHLSKLGQGISSWNAWRQDNPLIGPDLAGTSFEGINLQGADLEGVNLQGATLSGANLVEANLQEADLVETNLQGADLGGADLFYANLQRADLQSAFLYRAYLVAANFSGASLVKANLERANLERVDLNGADMRSAVLDETMFNNIDLSATKGLDSCLHRGPSSVDYRTITKSKNVPLVFWRGCGLPDALIEYMPSLTGDAIQFYSCFISYSSKDQGFADRLHADLQNAGVRCWFAPHDMRTGDRIRDVIDDQIRLLL